jgi:hypothetical protein
MILRKVSYLLPPSTYILSFVSMEVSKIYLKANDYSSLLYKAKTQKAFGTVCEFE